MAAGRVGLGREMAIVEAAFDTAQAGATQTVLIEGELGSGRTTLLGAARGTATERGLTTLATQGRRTDRSVGYAGLLTLLSGYTDRLDDLAEEHTDTLRAALSLSDTVAPLRVGVGLFCFLTRLAEEAPVCIAVDDEHLLDSASADALGFALGRLDADAVAAIVTSPSASVSRLADVAHQTVGIEPLSSAELIELIDDGTATDAGVLAEVATRSAGNPLVALSLAASLTAAQREGRESLPATPHPPEALIHQFEATLHDAGDSARRALVLVAADGNGDRGRITAALASLGEPVGGVSTAIEGGLLVSEGRLVRLAHPLLQNYAYHQVGVASRQAAHAALAAQYDQPSDAADRVWHLAAAAEGPDDELAANLDLVAREHLLRSDTSGACAQFRRAAELSSDPAAAVERLRAAAKAALEGGDAALAWATLDDARPEWGVTGLAGARAAIAPWVGAPIPAATPHDDEMVTSAARLAQARSDFLDGKVGDLTGDERAIAWDPAEMASLRARAWTLLGRPAAAESSTAALLATLPRHRTPVAAVVAAARADALLWLGDLDEAEAITEWAAPTLERAGLSFHFALLVHTAGSAAIARGDLDAAVARLEGVPPDHLALVIGELALALTRSGQPDVARAWLNTVPAHESAVPRIRRLRAEGLLGNADAFAEGLDHSTAIRLPTETAAMRAAEAEWLRHQGRTEESERIVVEARLQLRPLALKCPLFGPMVAPRAPAIIAEDDVTRTDDVTDALSPAELRVALSVSAGLTNKEAAAELFLSVKTVDFHLQNIYRKLRLRSRTELAVLMSGSGRAT